MNSKISIISLLIFLFLCAVITAAKKNTNVQGGRLLTDGSKKEVRLKDSDTIDIDISQDVRLLEGSGHKDDDDEYDDDDNDDDDDDDDDDDRESSGDDDDDDDDDDDVGSGASHRESGARTGKGMCLKLLAQSTNKGMIGAFVPRCTQTGEFAPLQCHGSTGQCWCADSLGNRIEGTSRKPPEMADCSKIDRDFKATTRRPSVPAGGRVPTRQLPSLSAGKPSKSQPVSPLSPARGGSSGSIFLPPTATVGPYRPNNKIDQFPFDPNNHNVYVPKDVDSNDVTFEHDDSWATDPKSSQLRTSIITSKPGVLAGIIGGAVIGLLCAILLVMFIVYRLCKNKEQVEEKSNKMPIIGYTNGHDRDLYA